MTVPVMTPRAAREQRAFRALLDGMARPGTVQSLGTIEQRGTASAAIALFESLVDHEVSFAVVPASAETEEAVLRLTGSRLAEAGKADYVLAAGDGVITALASAPAGEPEYPDRGTTVIAVVESVGSDAASGDEFVLEGPGISGQRPVWISGLAQQAIALFLERNREVPLGIDVVLIAPDGRFTCLPRYTRIRGGE